MADLIVQSLARRGFLHLTDVGVGEVMVGWDCGQRYRRALSSASKRPHEMGRREAEAGQIQIRSRVQCLKRG